MKISHFGFKSILTLGEKKMKKITIKTLICLVLPMLSFAVLSAEALALEEGNYAPCVVLTGLESNETEGSRCIRDPRVPSEGKRYTVLKFFSAFCSDCHRLHHDFTNKLSAQQIENANIHYVGIDRNVDDTRDYAATESLSLEALGITVFIDNVRDAKESYGVHATPTTFVLDRNPDATGNKFKIVYKHVGYMNDGELDRFISVIQNKQSCHTCL